MSKAKKSAKPNGPDLDHQSEPKSESKQPTLSIQRLFMKGVSFDAPAISELFGKEWKPQLDINIQSNNKSHSDNIHEVELTITINGKMNEETIFKIGVTEAGIFNIQNFNKDQLHAILGSECLKILFPYIREAVSDLTTRATLPQLYLTPINFDAIYLKQLEQKNQTKS